MKQDNKIVRKTIVIPADLHAFAENKCQEIAKQTNAGAPNLSQYVRDLIARDKKENERKKAA